MTEPKTIYCPRCGRRVACWDGKASMYISNTCNKCGKLIVFNPSDQKTEMKNVPARNQSSGKRFY